MKYVKLLLVFAFALLPMAGFAEKGDMWEVKDADLTVWDSPSSHLTLFVMLLVTCLLLPLVMLYTGWVYRVLRGKVSAESMEQNHHSY